MQNKITDTVEYIGVYDTENDLFEGQYVVPNGMAYNSYVIKDEKIAVIASENCKQSQLNTVRIVVQIATC